VGYAISKAALNMAVAKFAAALKQEGFVFLALSPGLVDTATEREFFVGLFITAAANGIARDPTTE
jgi:NAD(P)-dependent dehydrogenase (short-subunit alcohol dehydrogenase family)